MLMTIYTLLSTLSTLLMAVNCWAPALVILGVALGLSVWCFVQNRKSRAAEAQVPPARVAHLRG